MRTCYNNNKRFVWLLGSFPYAIMGVFTSRGVDVFGLELNQEGTFSDSLNDIYWQHVLTLPAIGPSWADLPFTLKVTPLGALDLTSRLAKNNQMSAMPTIKAASLKQAAGKSLTSRSVVEVLVKELSDKVSLAWDSSILRPPFPTSLRNDVGEWPTQHVHRWPP